ncbi:MAG: hypothetical protein R2991_02065 [Thermoanaerobaculia bacterium]
MRRRLPESLARPSLQVELFVLANLAFLSLDIAVAHSVNRFAEPAEWLPLAFSLLAPWVLLVALWLDRWRPGRQGRGRTLGLAVGWGSVAVGVGGLLFHLDSRFFAEQTLENLVYTAPFVAPLAYTGLGLLLLLDRTVSDREPEWARWVLLLAAGGFAGNFVLSLADHAQNGFFDPREWIAVGAAALGLSTLLVATVSRPSRGWLRFVIGILILEALVGLLGAWLHWRAILASPMSRPLERVVYSAPAFAPLLFPNLALLAALAVAAARPDSEPGVLSSVEGDQAG